MKPLFVLLITFLLSLLISWLFIKSLDYILAGNIAMCVMLLMTASGHFMFSEGMTMMLPDFIPFKSEVVFLTGILEICAAIALLIPSLRYPISILLIIFFVCLLPANIQAALKHIDYQNTTYNGPGIRYLWFRIPLQFFFIAWVWFFNIKPW
ncbi:Uncharacterized membrane protein [Fodinibius roseus]|uniref:Uncharacterized membrane protein n=1 Tax=Fodinibius roseus TaxID=1194090 RepID=A0A1M5HL58_9BACT|nr:Uncharacterized membrane protein [Fodinibius roseus]